MSLTVREIDAARPAAKLRKLSDGGGLQIWIYPNGVRQWRAAYRFAGKQKAATIGAYPEISLRDARARLAEMKAKLREGVDPVTGRKAGDMAPTDRFGDIRSELLRKKMKEGRSPETVRRYVWFEAMTSSLADRPISTIKAPDVLAVLRPIEEAENYATAGRLRGFIGEVFRHAVATGRAEHDPTPALRGALISKPTTPRAAIVDPKAFGGLLRAIDGYPGHTTRRALQLLALTFVRPGELRLARWSELDLAAGLWSIPAERMKMRRPHIVPLAAQAVAILREQHASTGVCALVFPGLRTLDRPISENTLNGALRRMGFAQDEMTGHGFRAAASTIMNQSRLFHPDVIERQLAHVEQNAVRRAYDRSDHLEERVRLMTWWADKCDALRKGI